MGRVMIFSEIDDVFRKLHMAFRLLRNRNRHVRPTNVEIKRKSIIKVQTQETRQKT